TASAAHRTFGQLGGFFLPRPELTPSGLQSNRAQSTHPSSVRVLSFGLSPPQFGEHVAFAHVLCPIRPELEVRLILNRLPVAAPFEPQLHADGAHCIVERGIRQVLRALKDADIEREAKVVVAVSGRRVGYPRSGSGSPLRVELRLLLVGTQ